MYHDDSQAITGASAWLSLILEVRQTTTARAMVLRDICENGIHYLYVVAFRQDILCMDKWSSGMSIPATLFIRQGATARASASLKKHLPSFNKEQKNEWNFKTKLSPLMVKAGCDEVKCQQSIERGDQGFLKNKRSLLQHGKKFGFPRRLLRRLTRSEHY